MQKYSIGNYFYPVNKDHAVHVPYYAPLKIVEVLITGVSYVCHDENPALKKEIPKIEWHRISPIYLNADIFKNCGFEFTAAAFSYAVSADQWEDLDLWQGQGMNIVFRNNAYYPATEIEDIYYSFLGREIKYLHELQNLCFVTRGKELEVNFG